MARCPGTTPAGTPCKANVRLGETWCRWHDPTPEGRARHLEKSRKGGRSKAYNALESAPPLGEEVRALDLTSAEGLAAYMAAALHQLATLRFDTRTANSIAALVNAQRATVEAASIEKRLAALEAAQPAALRRA